MTERAGSWTGRLRLAFIALFAAGVLFNGYRGPYRALFPPHVHEGLNWDFGLVYSLSRAWIIGANPYELEGVSRAWASSDGSPLGNPAPLRHAGILLYPPTTLATLAPLCALPWTIARLLWMAANIAGVALALWVAARLAGLRGAALWGFLAAGVWLAPFATNIAVGQTAVVTLLLIAAGQWSRFRNNRPVQSPDQPGDAAPPPRGTWTCGLLLGLATALKPQMGLLFIIYEAGRLRWRSAIAAAAVVVLTAGIGVARLEATGAPWWDSWQRNLHNFSRVEDGNPTRSNPDTRHQMLNLHYPLHNFTDDRSLVQLLVYAIVGALSLAYFLTDLRRGRNKAEGRAELISLSMTSVISLLVVYHRFYDAVLLVLPLALAVQLIAQRTQRAAGWTLLALCAVFFVPGSVVLSAAALKGWAPPALTGSWLWENILLPHETWALLAMAILLIPIRAGYRAPA